MQERISTIIVDDERDSRDVLMTLFDAFFPEIEVKGEAAGVEEAYELILQTNPKLVFLDIQMPRASGFNLLSKFESLPFEVIFVTSYDHYAINAIRFNALDYLLKPIDTTELKAAIEKAGMSIEKKLNSHAQIINLLHSLSPEGNTKKVAIHSGEKVKMLNCSDIISIEADGRYCELRMQDESTYTTARYLKDFEDYLSTDVSFIRISKSLIINIRYMKAYSKGDPCMIEMTNGKTVEVARRKKQEILERLKANTK